MDVVRDLPKYCSRLYDRGLVSSTGGNVSVRIGPSAILISPTGKALVDLTSDDFVEVTLDGAVTGTGRPSKELPFHLAAYRRPDVNAVIHGHCAYAVAASTMLPVNPEDSLPAYTAGYVFRVGRLPLLPYLPAGSHELSEAVGAVLTPIIKAILLQNHGFISIGPDWPRHSRRRTNCSTRSPCLSCPPGARDRFRTTRTARSWPAWPAQPPAA